MNKIKYKLIASDFDGTLATSKDTISTRNREAIAAYREAGGIFCVSTGRGYSSVFKKLVDLGLEGKSDVPIISYQGALITDVQSGKIIDKKYMDNSLVCDILKYGEKFGYYMQIYSYMQIFTEKDCENSRGYAAYTKTESEFNMVGKLSDFVKSSDKELLKVAFMEFSRDPHELCEELNNEFRGRMEFVHSGGHIIECGDKAAGKGNALKTLAKHYNIDIKDTIAIGDSMNDYSMLKDAGFGIAVSNANPKLKEIASLVGKSNDEDAVADIIEKILNNQIK